MGGSTEVPRTFPVSIKGVVVHAGRVLLLRNERDEWELPGGRLEAGERPEGCVVREIAEEVGWTAEVGPILDSWLYRIFGRHDVFVVTCGCHVTAPAPPVVSAEHKEIGLFVESALPDLTMPDGYKRSIAAWYARLHAGRDIR